MSIKISLKMSKNGTFCPNLENGSKSIKNGQNLEIWVGPQNSQNFVYFFVIFFSEISQNCKKKCSVFFRTRKFENLYHYHHV